MDSPSFRQRVLVSGRENLGITSLTFILAVVTPMSAWVVSVLRCTYTSTCKRRGTPRQVDIDRCYWEGESGWRIWKIGESGIGDSRLESLDWTAAQECPVRS